MRILVIGAGGFLGRAVVRACAAAGHEVRGLFRDPKSEPRIRQDGGVPVLADAAIPEQLRGAVRGCDAAIHLAAPSQSPLAPDRPREEWERSRVTVAQNLVNIAREEGTPKVLIGSGYWLYGDHRGTITEESVTQPNEIVGYNLRAERVGLQSHRPGTLDVVIVRPGMVYGNGAWFRPMVDAIRSGTYQYVGDGANRISPVGLEDCGDAFRTVAERGVGGETYLVADDLPVSLRSFTEFVAEQVGALPPSGLPWEAAVREQGEELARALSANQAASNRKLRALGWRPKLSTFRIGIPPAIREILAERN